MADRTGIQWTDASLNVVSGCDLVSPGCANCYARTLAKRLKAMGSDHYQRDGKPFTSGPGFGVSLHEDLLRQPYHWTRPRRIFICSMGDLFHEEVPGEFILRVWDMMAGTQRHTYQILTKRPELMAKMMPWLEAAHWRREHLFRVGSLLTWPLPNVWLGTSVESQYWADRRIASLATSPAVVRFLSCEPLLKPIDLSPWIDDLQWVIAGGESGPRHRPMDSDWVRMIRNQCINHEVPFFFKQHGGRTPKAGGRLLDGREWNEFPIKQEAA